MSFTLLFGLLCHSIDLHEVIIYLSYYDFHSSLLWMRTFVSSALLLKKTALSASEPGFAHSLPLLESEALEKSLKKSTLRCEPLQSG
jgi:hypothetical protein